MHSANANGSVLGAPATTTAPALVQAPAAPTAPIRVLRGVRKGRINAALRVMLYGPEGVGKTTWASEADAPIYLGKEGGTEQLDVQRLPEPTHWRDAPAGPDGLKRDCFSLVEDLLYAAHDYRSLVIDTIDWIEPLVFGWVCSNSKTKRGAIDPVNSINEAFGGYGKGYDVALDQWRLWIALLDRLRLERGMAIIVLGHAETQKFSNPEGEDFDMYGLKMHKKSGGIWREWCDAVLFAKPERFDQVKKSDELQGKKRYAVGSMQRVVFTQQRPAWYAKNRFYLPEIMPLDWRTFANAVTAKSPANLAEIVSKISEVAGFCPIDVQSEVNGMIERAAGNQEKLIRVLNWMQSQVDTKEVTA